MNRKTTYEVTITEKLQQLPLPDMADAIWARVEKQLDIDMPTDDGDGGNGPDAPSGSGWVWGSGIFIFVAAIVTAFFLTKNNSTQQPATQSPVFTTAPAPVPTQNEAQSRGRPAEGASTTSAPTFPPVKPAVSPLPQRLNRIDSLVSAPLTTVPQPDSQQRTTVALPPPVQVEQTGAKPKTKGVKGLTDNDYKIVPKKDSL